MKPETEYVDSDLGNIRIDHEGSPVSACRMEISKAYTGVPALLRKVIDNQDEGAWKEIGTRIDYIYTNLNIALTLLNNETKFIDKVKSDLKSGKKLFFKPNLVSPIAINYHSHDEGVGARICTDWTFLAALMRWFHDTLDISYHQMSMGEGSASCGLMAAMYSKGTGKAITPEAVFEGKSGALFGGWGFYFIRRYLSDRHPSSHTDNPMNGYEDSVAGRYVPPGQATDRLMVYDLNNLNDDPKRGRTVPVKDGACYKNITLHKVIIGGDPGDRADMKDYPGSVMVNVPKLKIHLQDLITNATKNLGIGLYPMECSSGKPGDTKWLYATPDTPVPTLKSKLPHCRRIVLMDDNTHLPVINQKGEYSITITPGMAGTQVDVIRATQDQGVFILHVVDAIDTINISHDDETAVRIPEGFVWTSLDCVALDLLCARYCFKTVPMKEELKLKEENGWNTEFVHHVPVAKVEGKNIITTGGYDSPLSRYNLFSYAESRGIGRQLYYVTGLDCVTGTPLASLNGHLGRIEKSVFRELMTTTMYYNPGCMLWDMQETLLSYAKAHDNLVHSAEKFYDEFMDRFDENHD
ncbi:MAG: DUF362 domain-containing protein, partial [Methanospirillum sp.]|nr:DUF362 domain-containing protein [Methanospirillum sp.]